MPRNSKSQSTSPYNDVRTELDNKVLKSKNYVLTQAIAKLQQEKADLLKQIAILQEESFEQKSRNNNLRNVVSVIDSSSRACLRKLTEVASVFPGIIQLCTVATDIGGGNKDTRTQAVKPHIVNGHVLKNPTITLSRLEGSNISNVSVRGSEVNISPSTSRAQENNDDNNDERDQRSEELNESFRSKANGGLYSRQSRNNRTELEDDDSTSSSEEMEMSLEENNDQSRLSIIHEMDGEDLPSPCTPRTKQKKLMNAKFQEVQIYLNQLPNTYVDRFGSSGNISISVTPPNKRPSISSQRSSLVAEADDSLNGDTLFISDEDVSAMRNVNKGQRGGQSSLTVNINCSSSSGREIKSHPDTLKVQHSLQKAIKNEATPSTSRYSEASCSSSETRNSKRSPRSERRSNCSGSFNSSSEYPSPSTPILKNITKRKLSDRQKSAQVVLNRLSLDKKIRFSDEMLVNGDIVKTPPLTSSAEINRKSRRNNQTDKDEKVTTRRGRSGDNEETNGQVNKRTRVNTTESSRKRGSIGRSPAARPRRNAKPKSMKEPSLRRKMRRSK